MLNKLKSSFKAPIRLITKFIRSIYTHSNILENPNVMIDLETLGNDYDGVFVSVGACLFNPDKGEIGRTFYRKVDWRSSIEAGRTVTAETIEWWISNNREAQEGILGQGSSLKTVLEDLRQFIPEKAKVWGNGSNFDIGKLETAYGFYNIPWDFWSIRDVRTIRDIASDIVDKDVLKFEGVEHNALDDAIHQAKYVSRMIIALNEAKKLYRAANKEAQ